MIEVFGYALVIGLGLGIGWKTAEGIVEAVDAFSLGFMRGLNKKLQVDRPDTGSTRKF